MAVAVASPSSMESRSSPAGSPGQQPPSHAPYPYPVHQQSSSSSSAGSPAASPPPQGWAPGPPGFYPWQGGYPAMAPQGFYDPNAAQFAQWYHHMMLQQQQEQQRQQQDNARAIQQDGARTMQQIPFGGPGVNPGHSAPAGPNAAAQGQQPILNVRTMILADGRIDSALLMKLTRMPSAISTRSKSNSTNSRMYIINSSIS